MRYLLNIWNNKFQRNLKVIIPFSTINITYKELLNYFVNKCNCYLNNHLLNDDISSFHKGMNNFFYLCGAVKVLSSYKIIIKDYIKILPKEYYHMFNDIAQYINSTDGFKIGTIFREEIKCDIKRTTNTANHTTKGL